MKREPQTEVGKILGFDPPELVANLPTASGKPRRARKPKAEPAPLVYPPLPELPCRILAGDPGFALFGFAILDVSATSIVAEEYGVVQTTPDMLYPDRLAAILEDFESLIKFYAPKLLVVEQFFSNNLGRNATAVAQARGLLIALAGKYKLPLFEPKPNVVKQRVHGNAAATKKEMQQAVSDALGLDHLIKPDDAADAIGNGLVGAWGLQQGMLDLLMRPDAKKAPTRSVKGSGSRKSRA